VWMLARPLLDRILGDDAVTRGLRDSEAHVLIEWLVEQAEQLETRSGTAGDADQAVQRLCRRARSIARFLDLWFNRASRGAACQLWAVERYGWPTPEPGVDAYESLHAILSWETAHPERPRHVA